MIRYLKLVAILFGIAIISFIIFYFWASSSQLEESDYTEIIDYKIQSNQSSDTLTIITYNIGYLSGMFNNQAEKVSQSVFDWNMKDAIDSLKNHHPDIIAFQEIDFNSNRSYHVNQLEVLANALNLTYGAKAVNWDKTYLPFPYWPPEVHFGAVESGQAVLSNFEITENSRQILKVPEDQPFWYRRFYLDRLLQISKLTIEDKTLIVANVHLEAFKHKTRKQQSREVVEAILPLKEKYPLILIGDFNAIPRWHFESGQYSDEVIEAYKDDDTIDYIRESLQFKAAVPDTIKDISRLFTFSTENPRVHIDHIFYDSSTIEAIDWRVIRSKASDHFPVMMKFKLKD